MTFAAVDASGGGEFLPQHPKSGDWYSLKGKMMAPYELSVLESTAMMNTRPQSDLAMPGNMWDADIVVSTPLTGGGGAMAK